MIRFVPDTWADALLRPIAMAVPDGGMYVEIMAPDFRFVFVLCLALALLVCIRNARRSRPILSLLALTAAAFVPWLISTGNGRYFIAFLLVVGPLCIGLIHSLPTTRPFRLALGAGMVLWQCFVLSVATPWHAWDYVPWGNGPAFDVQVPAEIAARPATYVTLSSISYSIIAPKFHPQSRWINISALRGVADKSPDSVRAQALIESPGPLRVIFPTVPGGQKSRRMDPALGRAIDQLLSRQALAIDNIEQCQLLPSAAMASLVAHRDPDAARTRTVHGFWLCPLVRHASASATRQSEVPARTEQVYDKLEHLCPRIFPPGETVSLRIPKGAVRGYPGSDFKLYVFDDGEVWYKYYRALNSVKIGNVDDVLDSRFKMDCDHIRGRSGLPWDREI